MSHRPWIHSLVAGALLVQALAPMPLMASTTAATGSEHAMPCHDSVPASAPASGVDCCADCATACAAHCGTLALTAGTTAPAAAPVQFAPVHGPILTAVSPHRVSLFRPPILSAS